MKMYEIAYQYIGVDGKLGTVHYDNSVEIIQTWSDGGYFVVKNQIFPITPGALFIVNAMDPHYSNPSTPSVYNRSKIIVPTSIFNAIVELCELKEIVQERIFVSGGMMFCPSSSSAIAKELDNLFKYAEMNFSSNPDSQFQQAIIIDCIIRILIIALHTDTNTNLSKSVEPKSTIQLLAEYLNMHMTSWQNISLTDLCNHLNISQTYASHLFKQLTKTSFHKYVMELRMAEAKKLLLNTDMKIQDIAESLNFQDSTTFCKTFKKISNCSPGNYRKSSGITYSNIQNK